VPVAAQQAGRFIVHGLVVDSAGEGGLPGISVQNLSAKTLTTTDADGSFSIEADWGARLQISGAGFKARFITITTQPLSALTITLRHESNTLKTVVVTRRRVGYAADSTARQATYARVLARQHEGSVMSPVSLLAEKLSRKSRRMFQFQKDFATGEEQRYIDTRYTPQLAAAQTQLSGDTLAYFMNAYPMPEDLARTSSDLEIKQWVRWNYKKWIEAGRPVPNIISDSTLRR